MIAAHALVARTWAIAGLAGRGAEQVQRFGVFGWRLARQVTEYGRAAGERRRVRLELQQHRVVGSGAGVIGRVQDLACRRRTQVGGVAAKGGRREQVEREAHLFLVGHAAGRLHQGVHSGRVSHGDFAEGVSEPHGLRPFARRERA